MKFLASFIALFGATSGVVADHRYTTDPHGELAPGAGYHLEGIACYAVNRAVTGTVPVYRCFDPNLGDYFYTTNPSGELAGQDGYDYEEIGYYLFPTEVAGTVPLYIWYGDGHFYSTKAAEGNAAGSTFEGVLGYVYPGAVNGVVPLYRVCSIAQGLFHCTGGIIMCRWISTEVEKTLLDFQHKHEKKGTISV